MSIAWRQCLTPQKCWCKGSGQLDANALWWRHHSRLRRPSVNYRSLRRGWLRKLAREKMRVKERRRWGGRIVMVERFCPPSIWWQSIVRLQAAASRAYTNASITTESFSTATLRHPITEQSKRPLHYGLILCCHNGKMLLIPTLPSQIFL